MAAPDAPRARTAPRYCPSCTARHASGVSPDGGCAGMCDELNMIDGHLSPPCACRCLWEAKKQLRRSHPYRQCTFHDHGMAICPSRFHRGGMRHFYCPEQASSCKYGLPDEESSDG